MVVVAMALSTADALVAFVAAAAAVVVVAAAVVVVAAAVAADVVAVVVHVPDLSSRVGWQRQGWQPLCPARTG